MGGGFSVKKGSRRHFRSEHFVEKPPSSSRLEYGIHIPSDRRAPGFFFCGSKPSKGDLGRVLGFGFAAWG